MTFSTRTYFAILSLLILSGFWEMGRQHGKSPASIFQPALTGKKTHLIPSKRVPTCLVNDKESENQEFNEEPQQQTKSDAWLQQSAQSSFEAHGQDQSCLELLHIPAP